MNNEDWNNWIDVALNMIIAERDRFSSMELRVISLMFEVCVMDLTSDLPESIASKLQALHLGADPNSSAALGRALNIVGATLLRRLESGADQSLRTAFVTIQRYFAGTSPVGLIWKGRPSQLSDSLLSNLCAEAECQRLQASRRNRAFVAPPGEVASTVVLSDWLSNLVVEKLGRRPKSSGKGGYIYYEKPGDGVDPHVDVEDYTLNVLFSLHSAASSTLVLYNEQGEPSRIGLTPGEVVLFHAGSTFHARTPTGPGERVVILVSGFRSEPLAEN